MTDPDMAAGRMFVMKLMREARVSTFVCFQKEVPPQTEIGKWPPGGVALHGRKCLPYAGLAKQFSMGRQLQFLYEPLEDLAAPGLEHLTKVVEDLRKRVLDGEVLYLHCWGGRGRSATVAACLLSRLYSISAEEAMERVQLGYDSRAYDNCRSPETDKQREVTRQFCGEAADAGVEVGA